MELRPYQQEAVERIRGAFGTGVQRVLLVAPTGSGKTVLAGDMIRRAVLRGRRVLFLAHRRELIDQCADKLDRFGVSSGQILAGRRADPLHQVQVASVQTLARREVPKVHLIFVDEAHHGTAASYQRPLAANPQAHVVGLTATPTRLNGSGLGTVFQRMVETAQPSKLIEGGFLVPCRAFVPSMPDLSSVRIRGGDFEQDALEKVMGRPSITGDLVNHWRKHAQDRRSVCFAVTVRHSQALCEAFCAAGARAEHLDGTTPILEREAILRRLASGETRIICNVGVLTEGWDCPEASACILARPTNSLCLYLQMVGRILRPAPWAGKQDALLLDHAGNALRFGLATDDRKWQLDCKARRTRKPLEELRLKRCKECYALVPTHLKACSECGFLFVPDRVEPRHRDGDLVEMGRRAWSQDPKRLRWLSERVKAWMEIKGSCRRPKSEFRRRFGHWPSRAIMHGPDRDGE